MILPYSLPLNSIFYGLQRCQITFGLIYVLCAPFSLFCELSQKKEVFFCYVCAEVLPLLIIYVRTKLSWFFVVSD